MSCYYTAWQCRLTIYLLYVLNRYLFETDIISNKL